MRQQRIESMDTLKRITINYSVRMLSDFHVGSGAGLVGFADRAVMRTAGGELVIPGSTIKGRTRHYCEQLARSLGLYVCGGRSLNSDLCKDGQPPCLICRLFGSEWRPGTIYFSDSQLTHTLRDLVREGGEGARFDYQVVTRTRTRLNRMLRMVEQGALFTFEEGTEGLIFDGRVSGRLLCAETGGDEVGGAPLEALALAASLLLIECLGGKKTVGLGECKLTINGFDMEGKDIAPSLREILAERLEELVLYDDYKSE